jgi:hypothetical protein
MYEKALSEHSLCHIAFHGKLLLHLHHLQFRRLELACVVAMKVAQGKQDTYTHTTNDGLAPSSSSTGTPVTTMLSLVKAWLPAEKGTDGDAGVMRVEYNLGSPQFKTWETRRQLCHLLSVAAFGYEVAGNVDAAALLASRAVVLYSSFLLPHLDLSLLSLP